MRELHKSVREKLKCKLSNVIATEGLEMDSETSDDLVYLMKQCASNTSEKNSFQELFWKQQLKAANLKNKKSMRWHPLIIKWCLYLQYRSSGAYETLRSSGVIQLTKRRRNNYCDSLILFHLHVAITYHISMRIQVMILYQVCTSYSFVCVGYTILLWGMYMCLKVMKANNKDNYFVYKCHRFVYV